MGEIDKPRFRDSQKLTKKNKNRYSSPKPGQSSRQHKLGPQPNVPRSHRDKLSTRSKSENSSSEITPNLVKKTQYVVFPDQWDQKTRNTKKKKKIYGSTKPWGSLPEDLIWNVFSRLDIQSLLKVSRVCITWFNLCNDKDIRPYYISKRAFLERKVIYKHLITKGTPVPLPVPEGNKLDSDFSHLAPEKRIFAENFYSGNHWYYNHIYQISADQLNKSGAYKKTLLPPTTYSKTKLVILFPDSCLNQIHYSVTVQGVELSSGRLTMFHILSQSDQAKDINLDPILLHASAFLRLIYLITLGVIKH